MTGGRDLCQCQGETVSRRPHKPFPVGSTPTSDPVNYYFLFVLAFIWALLTGVGILAAKNSRRGR